MTRSRLRYPTVRRPRLLGAVLAAILATIVALLAGIWLGSHPTHLPSPLRGSFLAPRRGGIVTEQALDILTTRYFRPLDRSHLVDLGLAGMVAGLDDPYSRYIDPRAYQASRGGGGEEVVGIGIHVAAEPDGLRVVDVLEHSPAARAGLMPGDVILKVGSTSLAGHDEDFGSKQIRGPAGTTVTLTVRRGESHHVLPVTRAKIVVPPVVERMLDYHGVHIGYLHLTGFAEHSGEELRTATQTALRGRAQAIILDLRENGGGLISEAITVASIFLAHGTIMSAVERGQPPRVYSAQGDPIAPRIPLVVLVDHGTASSAEIVTAALQDHGRAKVVGTHTYGKGVFQLTLPLMNGGALDITIGEFFTPDGRNLGDGVRHGAGIEPNVYVSDSSRTPTDEALGVAESTVSAEVRAEG